MKKLKNVPNYLGALMVEFMTQVEHFTSAVLELGSSK